MRLHTSDAERPGDSTVVARAAASGKLSTRARPGRGLKAVDFLEACWAGSESMSRDRIPTRFTRRWKWEPALEPEARNQWWAADNPVQRRRQLRRQVRHRGRLLRLHHHPVHLIQ